MWISKAPYPVKPDLPLITRHNQLPNGCSLLAHIPDNTTDRRLYFVNNNGHLSVLDMVDRHFDDGDHYYRCAQDDFPLELLIWFPIALEEFQKPPAEGGLHAGGMTTPDMDVGGGNALPATSVGFRSRARGLWSEKSLSLQKGLRS